MYILSMDQEYQDGLRGKEINLQGAAAVVDCGKSGEGQRGRRFLITGINLNQKFLLRIPFIIASNNSAIGNSSRVMNQIIFTIDNAYVSAFLCASFFGS